MSQLNISVLKMRFMFYHIICDTKINMVHLMLNLKQNNGRLA